MIDLHLHTTSSDGRSEPEDLVWRAADAGLHTIAVTDHDTTAGVARARDAARPLGIDIVMGIEITAIQDGRDVHLLGYFFDDEHPELAAFLEQQRADRRTRVDRMLERLRELGLAIDAEAVRAHGAVQGKAIGRPAIARALVAAGHVKDVAEAFDRYLADGCPAFVPREGASPREVVQLLGRAGGVSSFAHPGKLGLDHLLPELAAAGLTAIEAFHPDHAAVDRKRYLELSRTLGLAVSGGSDYHGPGSGRVEALGVVHLPHEHFETLQRRAGASAGSGASMPRPGHAT